MYIRIASDLHLEQYVGKDTAFLSEKMLPADEKDKDSVLILAGDISSKQIQLLDFLKFVSKRFKHTIFVCGNHEWYKNNIDTYSIELRKEFDNLQNISAASNEPMSEVIIDNIRYIYGTLWANCGTTELETIKVQLAMNDFKLISRNQELFHVSDMKMYHCEAVKELITKLSVPFSGKTVVVTHHMPSLSLCHPRFGKDINGGFASNLDYIFYEPYSPNLWICGHTHDTIDAKINNCRIVINPVGYRGEYGTKFNSYWLEPKFVPVQSI